MNSVRVLAASCLCLVASADQEPPTGVRVLDAEALLYQHPKPVVSPDGRRVAYISRGFVCVVDVVDGNRNRLQEVKNSWTEVMARPEFHRDGRDFQQIARGMPTADYKRLVASVTSRIHQLGWTDDSDSLLWSVTTREPGTKSTTTDFWVSPVAGPPRRLVRTDHSVSGAWGVRRQVGPGFMASSDLRHLVYPGYQRPLIWRVGANEPVATPFLALTRSSTSDRWIGIEKDTRQLVITDADFEVTERFDVYRNRRSWGFELLWSSDERFVLWRNQVGFDHYSNWKGFLLDLESGERRELKGQFMREQFGFTGRGGELLRCGADGKRSKRMSGSDLSKTRLVLYPGAVGEPLVLWEQEIDPKDPRSQTMARLGGQAHASPDGSLFAVSLLAANDPSTGFQWHLIDRDKKTYPLPDGVRCTIAGFADGGKTLIGHTNENLLAIPVGSCRAR